MKAYPDFFPHKTWGSLIGDRNRYTREEWDEKECNELVGGSKGENCIGNTKDNFLNNNIFAYKILLYQFLNLFYR